MGMCDLWCFSFKTFHPRYDYFLAQSISRDQDMTWLVSYILKRVVEGYGGFSQWCKKEIMLYSPMDITHHGPYIEIDVDLHQHVILTNIYTTRTLYGMYLCELLIHTELVYYIPYISGDIFVECLRSSKLICSHSYDWHSYPNEPSCISMVVK